MAPLLVVGHATSQNSTCRGGTMNDIVDFARFCMIIDTQVTSLYTAVNHGYDKRKQITLQVVIKRR